MLISKSDLYKGEWLDLVFKNRNHNYGAYQLRQIHENVMSRTMTAVFITAALFGTVVTVIAHSKPLVAADPLFRTIPVDLPKDQVYQAQQKKELPKAKPKVNPPAQAPKSPSVATQEYRSMVAAPDHLADEPKPLVADVAVGSVDSKGDKNVENAAPEGLGEKTEGKGTGEIPGGNDPMDFAVVQVMPEPVGGMEAWNKFLQKNIRYPRIAQENGVSGKSFVSFIIERDGSLSNVTILRKGGNGFDEEAMRVLKLAKAWKPGLQNGQAVRVRYVIPINFQLEEQ